MRNPFPPELRTMAIVPRWCIVNTTLKDNVATHSYFVAVYAYMIAQVIGWKGPETYLFMNALMHDNDETITGDITGPYKSVVMNPEAEPILRDKTVERMGGLIDAYTKIESEYAGCASITGERMVSEEVNSIVAVADTLDAFLFLVLNKRMGNTLVDPALDGGIKSLEGKWRRLPAPKEVLDRTWNTVVLPSIQEHYEKGARGAAPGVNI